MRRVTVACCATNYDQLRGVVEHKDASEAQREIREVNTGVLAYPAALLKEYLPRVGNANAQGEYYLPDVLAMAVENGHGVAALRTLRTQTRTPWASTTAASWPRRSASCRQRIAVQLMRDGVTLADPARIDVRGSLRCGRDVHIDVGCVFEGTVHIGAWRAHRTPLRAARLPCGRRAHGACHEPYRRLPPWAVTAMSVLRAIAAGHVLAEGARVGNFVETKKAQDRCGQQDQPPELHRRCAAGRRRERRRRHDHL
jgi:bifunctional UDP-N-acetylglucosamine pyrophosphorylase/glucosamine-1-phosphate N-acetyltransferase